MNQSILFNDDMTWDASAQQLRFTAQSSGARIICQVTLNYLQRQGLSSDKAKEIVGFAQLIQFDIEEDAQQAIADEHLENGILYLS